MVEWKANLQTKSGSWPRPMGNEIKEKLTRLPTEPGVYLMKDAAGKVLYVGKAVNLRSRVRSYFQDSADLQPRIRQMVEEAADLDYVVVGSEKEALILEFNLIQEHRPYYNVRFRDDKRYPLIRIPVSVPYPPVMVVRRPALDGARYFGPYVSTRSMRETIRLLRRLFGLRFARRDERLTCAGYPLYPNGLTRRRPSTLLGVTPKSLRGRPSTLLGVTPKSLRGRPSTLLGVTPKSLRGRPSTLLGVTPKSLRGRPCLDYSLGLCLGPCAGAVSEEEYAAALQKTVAFLEGHNEGLLRRLREEMEQASEQLRFEAAARLRDRISAVEAVTAKQMIVAEKREDADLIAAALEQDLACVVVFQVREGRLIGQNHFFLEGITGLEEGEVLTTFLKTYYLWSASAPNQVLLTHQIEDKPGIANLLMERRGGRVRLLAPQKGKKRKLIELAARNAEHYLREALGREETSRRKAEEALVELKNVLGLPSPPARIECYDISNLFGRQAVGSMVVFEGGAPKKSDYRRFKIHLKEGQPAAAVRPDDFAMMREVLTRRLESGLQGSERFPRMPDLILVDGGKGQLNVALSVLQQAGLNTPAAGLAKEFEHLYVKQRPEPIVLPRHSRSLHLLQAIRDEAHRFAISYHRVLRKREAVTTILRSIPGIGPKRHQALLSRFPSLEAIRRASVEEVAAVPGMTRGAAETLLTNLRAGAPTTSSREEE